MNRLAPLHEQPHAHDLEVELMRVAIVGRNRGLSHECICQALQAAFYRLCAAEVGGDPTAAVRLCTLMIEGTLDEFVLACHKEAAALALLDRPSGVTIQ